MPNPSELLQHDTDYIVIGAAAFFLNGELLAEEKEDSSGHWYLEYQHQRVDGPQAQELFQQLKWLVEVTKLLHKIARELEHFPSAEHYFSISTAVWNTCLSTPKGRAFVDKWKAKGFGFQPSAKGITILKKQESIAKAA